VQQSCMQLRVTATVMPGSLSFAEALACAAYMLLHMLRTTGRLIVVPPGCARDWDLYGCCD
jgi:hypothetical protein